MPQAHNPGHLPVLPNLRIGMLHTPTIDEKASSNRDTAWPARSYSSMAEILGNQAGLAIYRRFATLNAQNLLYLQSELVNLEDELKRLVLADSNSDDEQRRVFLSDIAALKSAPADATAGRQWKKILEIRVKLNEYNEALLQHSQLYQLPKANRHDLRVLREWYGDPDFGAEFLPWPEGKAWNEEMTEDLVALSARKTDGDVFTRWITEKIMPKYHRKVGYRLKKNTVNGIIDYRDSKFNSTANTISIILSSLIPPASIFALYYVNQTPVRLGLIMVFSAILAACLAIFTAARRVEIFAATVALASVQVVFIGTNNGGSTVP